MKIEIIQPVGYCSGVSNAISKAISIKKEHGNKPVFILGSLVHNSHVINSLESIGIKNLSDNSVTLEEKINSLDNGSIIIFTAHGHDEKVDKIAKEKDMIIYDCVCPKVKSNLIEIKNRINSGYEVIFIGINNHPETVASLSISEDIHLFDAKTGNFEPFNTSKPVFVTNQTTLNFKEIEGCFDKIKSIYPNAIINNEICPATRIRQENILKISPEVDAIFVVGDKNSSNTKRLYEISINNNKKASTYLVSSESDLTSEMLINKHYVVITSGTSTPPEVINSIANKIEELTK
ncbi:MAG: 4-hydroxy-3-methylbut-2-enyl diphosphate reductase [Bacilli bacterium]|nr:4-hydroxy-3-methylbut-2-enyl diphosphate reductase [Bacilli bacterium]